jgi:hypothetical protein
MLQVDETPEGEDERVVWIFFSTLQELNKYIKKVETPPKKSLKSDGVVVKFNKYSK